MERTITAQNRELLWKAMRRNGMEIAMPCGGTGKCGKCTVILDGEKVRSCSTYIEGTHTVVCQDGDAGVILADAPCEIEASGNKKGLGAAVDLGTTTLVVSVYDLETGALIKTESCWNCLKTYGADVISRIDYIKNNGALSELSLKIRTQVADITAPLGVRRICVAGNTVMQHIFAGIDPSSIAVSPFEPKTLFEGCTDELEGAQVLYSPCVAGYVGGDITAGILASGIAGKEGRYLYIDVGTNGEMALGGKDGFLCCSCACGPAFEGAQISCGMPGLEGAVSHVKPDGDRLAVETIADAKPAGICGSGLVDLAAALLARGDMDGTGRLYPGEVEIADGIGITQSDIRQLQLAKAAVRAGIAVLMKESGTEFEDIDSLVLCGGFGTFLDTDSACAIDMLPKELSGRTVSCGNTSLRGAALALLDDGGFEKALEIKNKCKYLELSGNGNFDDEYIEHMTFGEDI